MPNTYVALDKVTVGTAVSSVTFSSIPATYTDLVVVMSAAGSSYVNSYIRFNGDTATNYSATRIYGNGTSASSARYNTETFSYIGDLTTSIVTTIIQIQNYANTTTYKTFLSRDSAAAGGLGAWVGLWRKSPIAAITSIEIGATSGNCVTGSTFSLYGIKAEPVPTAKATGGTIRYSVDGYTYHTFTASGTFTPTQSLTADILVVAGGGAGSGYATGGGGGAGGLLTFTGQSLTATGYTCTVGAGGTMVISRVSGADGNTSQFGALTASVGGGGGGVDNTAGRSGGSGGGGGGGASAGAGGAATSGQGFNGGAGYAPGSDQQGGGGGGAGAVGQAGAGAGSGVPQNGGNGGSGLTNSFINAIGITTGTGQLVSGNYYFGGGGGGHFGGVGGSGGGGGGTTAGAALSGAANTGGGGKGGGSSLSGSGGSGIVVIRYPSA